MAKIYGQLEKAQVENVNGDPSNTPDGLIWLNTAASKVKTVIGAAVKVLVTEDQAQTLTNKTISGASNTLTNIPANTALTSQVPIANGGTGAATATAGFNALSPLTTKGDLIARDASNNVRVAVGADGLFLKADSGASAGVSWASPAGANIAVTSKTANYTVSTSDDVITGDASGGNFTLTLPTAVGNTGKVFRIKRTDQTLANKITIDGNGSETIDGALTKLLKTQYEEFTIVSDGSNWQILSHTYPQVLAAYTPGTNGLGTAASIEMFWKREGNCVLITGNLTTGTVSAAEARVDLPSGLTSKAITSIRVAGVVFPDDVDGGSNISIMSVLIEPSVTYLTFGFRNAGNASLTKQNGSGIFNNSTKISIQALVPVLEWEG